MMKAGHDSLDPENQDAFGSAANMQPHVLNEVIQEE